jgi:hypothetical protein
MESGSDSNSEEESVAISSGLENFSEDEDEDENPHGFMFAHSLDTYKKNKRERKEDRIKGKEEHDEYRA